MAAENTRDYRELLKKYMRNVIEDEGIAFLPSRCGPRHPDLVEFTPEECDALAAIREELRAEGVLSVGDEGYARREREE